MTGTSRRGPDRPRSRAGFTLVELMLALALGSLVLTLLMTSFLSQHQVYRAQGLVVEMQQNARVAMDMLEQDIRSIGFDPDRRGAAIIEAEAERLVFSRDDGSKALETISYGLIDAFASVDGNDGIIDDLGRGVDKDGLKGGLQPVAENISRLEFRYLDNQGRTAVDRRDISAVQVSMLVLSAHRETKMQPGRPVYSTPGGAQWQAPAGYWQVYLTTLIHCRNLGR